MVTLVIGILDSNGKCLQNTKWVNIRKPTVGIRFESVCLTHQIDVSQFSVDVPLFI